MANPIHQKKIETHAKENNKMANWNKWRDKHHTIAVDLSEADLSLLNLSGADLSNANLYKTDFAQSNCADCDFSGANCQDADFRETNLRGAIFLETDLRGAETKGAKNADFSSALLTPREAA